MFNHISLGNETSFLHSQWKQPVCKQFVRQLQIEQVSHTNYIQLCYLTL
jgi:hypothetical protein